MIKTKKVQWIILLMLAMWFFLLGFSTGNYIYNIITISITFFVYRKGYSDLFGEYDQRQKEKKKKADKIYKALQENKKMEDC